MECWEGGRKEGRREGGSDFASMSSSLLVSVVQVPSLFFTLRLVPSICHESSAPLMAALRGSSARRAYTAIGWKPCAVLLIIQRRSHTNVSRRRLGTVPQWNSRSDRERDDDDHDACPTNDCTMNCAPHTRQQQQQQQQHASTRTNGSAQVSRVPAGGYSRPERTRVYTLHTDGQCAWQRTVSLGSTRRGR